MKKTQISKENSYQLHHNRHIVIRLVMFDYQIWIQFTIHEACMSEALVRVLEKDRNSTQVPCQTPAGMHARRINFCIAGQFCMPPGSVSWSCNWQETDT